MGQSNGKNIPNNVNGSNKSNNTLRRTSGSNSSLGNTLRRSRSKKGEDQLTHDDIFEKMWNSCLGNDKNINDNDGENGSDVKVLKTATTKYIKNMSTNQLVDYYNHSMKKWVDYEILNYKIFSSLIQYFVAINPKQDNSDYVTRFYAYYNGSYIHYSIIQSIIKVYIKRSYYNPLITPIEMDYKTNLSTLILFYDDLMPQFIDFETTFVNNLSYEFSHDPLYSGNLYLKISGNYIYRYSQTMSHIKEKILQIIKIIDK